MLALTRKVNEGITIGKDVEVVVLKASRGRVQIGIRAPRDTQILRSELLLKDRPDDRSR